PDVPLTPATVAVVVGDPQHGALHDRPVRLEAAGHVGQRLVGAELGQEPELAEVHAYHRDAGSDHASGRRQQRAVTADGDDDIGTVEFTGQGRLTGEIEHDVDACGSEAG